MTEREMKKTKAKPLPGLPGGPPVDAKVVSMVPPDVRRPQVVARIKALIEELKDLMNEADKLDVNVDFGIRRKDQANPKSPFVVIGLNLVHRL